MTESAQSSIPDGTDVQKDKDDDTSASFEEGSTVSNLSQPGCKNSQWNLSLDSSLLQSPSEGMHHEHRRSQSDTLEMSTKSNRNESELQKVKVDDTTSSNTVSDVSQPESKCLMNLPLGFMQRPASANTYRELYRTQSIRSLASPTESEESNAEIQKDKMDGSTASSAASGTATLQSPVTDLTFSPWCIDCVRPYQVVAGDEIQAGDHIVYAGRVYDHHAIVISVAPSVKEPHNEKKRQVTVVHASNTIVGISAGITKFFGGKAKIMRAVQEVDFQKTKTLVVKYFNNQYTPEQIVERAIHEQENLGTDAAKFQYNLFENNCEHFATWCVTGQKLSVQVGKFRMTINMAWSIGLQGLGDETKRNDEAYCRDLLCKPCYERNKKLFAVPKQPVRSSKDVRVGDIITYSYYRLRHDAVVMEIKNSSQHRLEVLVAHYAFCGLFAHRTIKQEPLVIPFDGSVTVADYSGLEYNCYAPKEVVERAQSRLDEQMFAFFANDSCHFARWCKLRRTPSKETEV